jgi:hypothetical protein
VVYLRYSFTDIEESERGAIDVPKPAPFKDLDEARAFIHGREERGRYLIYSGTLFRKERGREINLLSYSRDKNNDLQEMPLV